jgi:hypothetical protein
MMNGNDQVLGIVENGGFQRLAPPNELGGPTRLTSISPQAAQLPETGEFDLSDHEGSTIMVTGHDQGEWILSPEVIDQARPILKAVVKKVFGEAKKAY